MTKVEQMLAIAVITLITLTGINYYADFKFRDSQIIINETFIKLHENQQQINNNYNTALEIITKEITAIIGILISDEYDKVPQRDMPKEEIPLDEGEHA